MKNRFQVRNQFQFKSTQGKAKWGRNLIISERLLLLPCSRLPFLVLDQGGFRCGPCDPGYTGHGSTGCSLGDYCSIDKNNCHTHATCAMTGAGQYRCQVKACIGGRSLLVDASKKFKFWHLHMFSALCLPLSYPQQPAMKVTQQPLCGLAKLWSFVFFYAQCSLGFAGPGEYCGEDKDLDGWPSITLQCRERSCIKVINRQNNFHEWFHLHYSQ